MYPYIFGYLIAYISGGIFDLKKSRLKYRVIVLFFFCFCLALLAGFRDYKWPDTGVYIESFTSYISPLGEDVKSNQVLAFSEPLFIFISRVIKFFTHSERIYLVILSFITMFLLCKALKNICIGPIIGLCVYISRFYLSRNLMQIRAALALVIILFSIKFVNDRNFRGFVLVIVLATLTHYSAIIAFPLYWMNRRILSNRALFYIIICCFIIVGLLSVFTMEWIAKINSIIGLTSTYVGGDENYSKGHGLLNPMIYYQIIILYLFSKSKYERLDLKYYHIIRNAYIYSTLVLIFFSPFLVLSARLSTVFATVEIFIIPILINKNKSISSKYLHYLGFGIILLLIYYINLNKSSIYL